MELHKLPNGLEAYGITKNETEFLYKEIFEDRVYLRHGIEIHDGACVVDVGANIGMFTLFVHSVCKPGKVYSIEPLPPIFDVLKANVDHRQCDSVQLCNVGLGDHEGTAEFVYYPMTSIMSGSHADRQEEIDRFKPQLLRSHPDFDPETAEFFCSRAFANEQKYQCRISRLSGILRENKTDRVDLLKIDVEKGELDVLAGIADEHWSMIQQAVIEVHDIKGRVQQITQDLRERAFHVVADQSDLATGTPLVNVYARRASG